MSAVSVLSLTICLVGEYSCAESNVSFQHQSECLLYTCVCAYTCECWTVQYSLDAHSKLVYNTFCFSEGVPKCIVRVTSVVPSLCARICMHVRLTKLITINFVSQSAINTTVALQIP